jgi:hypothetical protein
MMKENRENMKAFPFASSLLRASSCLRDLVVILELKGDMTDVAVFKSFGTTD